MIEMACPSCGRAGQVPKEKLHTRLVCRKCHVVFHMDPGGRAVIGDPNQPKVKEPKKPQRKPGQQHPLLAKFHIPTLYELTHAGGDSSEFTFPTKPALGALGVLVVGWMMFGYFAGASESVADRARIVADALVREDVARLKSFATDDTREDVVKWYDVAHTKLESSRKVWPSKDAIIQIVTVEEDPRSRKGEVEAFFLPAPSTAPPAAVIPTAATSPSTKNAGPVPMGPVSFHLLWIWNGSHWMLDGRQSFAMATRTGP